MGIQLPPKKGTPTPPNFWPMSIVAKWLEGWTRKYRPRHRPHCIRHGPSCPRNCVNVPNFVWIGQTVAKMWRFLIFQMGGRRHLGFSKFQNFNAQKGQRGQTASSYQFLWRLVKPLMRYGNFSIFPRCRPSAILDLCCACLDHQWRVFGSLYHYSKFGWNLYRSFDDMQVLIFCDLGLKTPIRAPKIVFLLGDLTPGMGTSLIATPKRQFLARKHVTWRIDRQNRSTGAGCASRRMK